MKKSFLPPFGKVFLASIFLLLIGGAGIFLIIHNFEPRLGPRWLFFFFLTILGAGVAMPASYFIQRRFATRKVPGKVFIREGLMFGIFLSLLAWLQLGRILNNLIIIIIAVGFLVLEMLLRMAEKATFKAEDGS